MDIDVAPCIAVVGPANAGKTTLLHQLDERLQKRLPAVLVLKGNPDGTGRYQFHSPNLREALKAEVKGRWGDVTVERICEWIDQGRRNLNIALLDFGGRYNPISDDRMLSRCSHYIVVSRLADTEGAEHWNEICRRNHLQKIGWMQSVGPDGRAPHIVPSSKILNGTFRFDAGPEDTMNDSVLAPLVELIVGMSRKADVSPYIDLHRTWTADMILTVGGLDQKIREMSSRVGAVVLGGAAPIWAYLAGLHCALEANQETRVFFFDPKQPQRLVEIPARHVPGSFPEATLQVDWEAGSGLTVLRFKTLTTDKFLPPAAAQNLQSAPWFGEIPDTAIGLYGAGPTWLYGTYARWLMGSGVRHLRSWDGRTEGYITVWE
jgi:hypothetical protein